MKTETLKKMEQAYDSIKTAIKRIKWSTTDEMDTLINEFVEQFSQAYFDGFDEKMEEVDIEEFVKIIEEKLREHNERGKLA